jgi:hypothetical protein
MKTSVFFVILLSALALAYRGWEPIDIDDIPKAQPNDRILVLQLEAPLFFAQFGTLLAKFNLFHSGVGFVNLNSKYNWTVEYDALPTFYDSVMPKINRTGGQTTLEWTNYGGAIMYGEINSTYWNKQVVVTEINGTLHNSFIEWLRPANFTWPKYNLFNVMERWASDAQQRHVFKPGFTCMDFQWACFGALHELGAEFPSTLTVKRNYMNVYTGVEPVRVDFNDPKHTKRILDQYEFMELKFKQMKLIDIIIAALDLIAGELYLRFDNEYYLVRTHSPHFNILYKDTKLPGQKNVTMLYDTVEQECDMPPIKPMRIQ